MLPDPIVADVVVVAVDDDIGDREDFFVFIVLLSTNVLDDADADADVRSRLESLLTYFLWTMIGEANLRFVFGGI